MNLKNKIALVTGASRGIGRSIAHALAKHGANVIINYDQNDEKALELQQELESKYHVDTLLIKADVSNENEVKEMINKIVDQFGKIDILINNAGIAIDTTFEDKTVENFRKILAVNLIGPFLTSKYASVSMLENHYGKIVNIASTNGIDTNYPESLDYDASKAGLISLTHNLAEQFSPIINVNCVAPGWVNTDMNRELSTEFVDKENQKIMLNRFGNPNEIASVVLFLVSDEASYINSEVIRVDGGKR